MATSKNANYLYSGTAWNIEQGAIEGTPVILTYSYVTAMPTYYSGYATVTSEPERPSGLAHNPGLVVSSFPAGATGWFDLAMAAWSNVAGISWAQPPSGVPYGQMTLGFVSSNPAFIVSGGVAFFPSSSINLYGTAGDVWIVSGSEGAPGTQGFSLFMHEIGHGLGLDHAGVSSPLGSDSAVTIPAAENTQGVRVTIISMNA